MFASRPEPKTLASASQVGIQPAWEGWEALLLLLFYLALNFLAALVGRQLFGKTVPVFFLAVTYVALALFMLGLLTWLVTVWHRQDFYQALGLSLPQRRYFLLAFFLAGCVMFAYYLLAAALKIQPPLNPIMKLLTHGKIGLFLFIGLVICLAPVTEELIFRGFVYEGLKQSWGGYAAAGFVSFCFALMHLPANFLVFFTLCAYSLAFIYLKERSHSLTTAIFAHILINAAPLVLLKFLEYFYQVKYEF